MLEGQKYESLKLEAERKVDIGQMQRKEKGKVGTELQTQLF